MKILIVGLALSVSLAALAKPSKPAVSMPDAKKTALARVEGGTIKSAELEKEHGRLIYSFDIIDRQKRIIEVNVDANSGKIVAVEEESPQKERQEENGEKIRR